MNQGVIGLSISYENDCIDIYRLFYVPKQVPARPFAHITLPVRAIAFRCNFLKVDLVRLLRFVMRQNIALRLLVHRGNIVVGLKADE